MAKEVSCPNCTTPVDAHARYCEHCGVDLAMAAVVAEQAMVQPASIPDGVPLAPEILVPRIGDTMIEEGYLTEEDLRRALSFQARKSEDGFPILIGQALLELGLVSRETLDKVITQQILQLQRALSDANHELEQRVKDRTQDLQHALERLTELNQLKSNFIANISHELRTPLTHIRGYLDIIIDGGLGEINPAQKDALSVVQRAEERLESLIEDLIQFSLASKGELSLTLKDVNPEELISMSVARSEHKAMSKGVRLVSEVSRSLPAIQVDEEKLGWVFLQLVDNSVKFTPSGGAVKVSGHMDGGLVSFAVSDTGIGIPDDRLDEIFETFHQLDGSATRRYGGTGLGLSMVRKIVEAHGARISVTSKVGGGTTMSFALAPVKENGQRSGIKP